ncbi:MAG: 1-acyl-sn-glycerol-3-phosphate acyltransferase [Bdellovibrionota bacterium]
MAPRRLVRARRSGRLAGVMRREDEAAVASEVVGRVLERSLAGASGPQGRPVEEIINETLYHERTRLSKAGDGETDRAYYARVAHELPHASEARRTRLLQEIIERYAREITGHFDPRVYAFATRLAPFALTALLNSLSPRRLLTRLRDVPGLDEHIIIQGEVETLRRLRRRGTVILAPTHSSNMDSVVMGYAIHEMGLPPFTYGAGLNLFSNPIIGYFMRNLGAYTVDRLKTDPLYRETLKEYATVALEWGYHTLFFPGGTRSRSGAVEKRLKKGLLGTGLSAFRGNLRRKRTDPRIYIFPCTISYPIALEAGTLIEDYLKEAGKSRYIIVDDEFSRLERWLDFARGLFELDLRIYLRVGRPLDPFGNDVDEEGDSLDPRGRKVDPEKYLLTDGEITEDPVRDAEYTGTLASRLLAAFHQENTALPTNVAAFACFELLKRKQWRGDLYRFLRGLGPEISLPLPEVEQEVEKLLGELREKESAGQIRLSRTVSSGDVAETMRRALRSFGTYHTNPVLERRGVRLHVGDANLVFYYRNRLEGYGLLGAEDLVQRRKVGP